MFFFYFKLVFSSIIFHTTTIRSIKSFPLWSPEGCYLEWFLFLGNGYDAIIWKTDNGRGGGGGCRPYPPFLLTYISENTQCVNVALGLVRVTFLLGLGLSTMFR